MDGPLDLGAPPGVPSTGETLYLAPNRRLARSAETRHRLKCFLDIPMYSLCPAVSLDEIVRQERAAVAGHSAGGHGVAMALATRWAENYGISPRPGFTHFDELDALADPASDLTGSIVDFFDRRQPCHKEVACSRSCRTTFATSWPESPRRSRW
ncbi:hypothetical protein [Amycolatopsis sp. NPDC051372]|uniref:hypothetical protein n=1 Tax=unclassified Amycolatopsis TaxID=2618356 RepID=UPI003443B215